MAGDEGTRRVAAAPREFEVTDADGYVLAFFQLRGTTAG
jgi:hypothetical protein